MAAWWCCFFGFFLTCHLVEFAKADAVGGKIAAFPACHESVFRLCGDKAMPNDLAVLDCLQDGAKSDTEAKLNDECHSVC